MNKTIKLAVAGAVLSAASIANAGIVIPAGEWTMDINGNVNMFATMTKADDTATVSGGIAATQDASGEDTYFTTGTGLLPAWLGFTGTTRQNDLDVSFTISFQPNTSDNDTSGMGDSTTPLNRQAFITFGDASWGSVKVGKDLGIFAGDAILSDMTLLGVGGGVPAGKTTLGGIGTGYLYPGWRGQIAYTTPNMNGLQATVAITNPNQGNTAAGAAYAQDRFGIEGKVVYSLSNGKVWVSGSSYDVTGTGGISYDATAMDVGTTLNFGNLGFTAYYYSGEGNGVGTSLNRLGGVANERDQDGGYVQATYVIPTGTKLGVAIASNRQDLASGETAGATDAMDSNDRWTVGAYHPLTKHLNLVAEYNAIESKDHQGDKAESDSISVGAILFF
ncbi:porin [Methylophilaceae bacterium]|nr:porin [Methylophilaceae bacterium]